MPARWPLRKAADRGRDLRRPRDDFGYQAQASRAAAELKKMPGIKVVEEENVPGDRRRAKTMTVHD
ncbi:hypothetical protein [Ottowia sp.]|uniref:hypothetical protein n=1 Tax=Ottowia sp. TaxID=1898956 RepID=UPI0025D34A89|nr:hypothetical protein [Ottowia sp.]